MMSGEKLADNEEFVSELLHIEPEAIGGEMEAAGVYSAVAGEHLQHVHWTVVKGICDWGLGKDDSHQAAAALNAIDFVFHVLEQPAIAESIRNLRS
jgi:nucleoside phosphorylase